MKIIFRNQEQHFGWRLRAVKALSEIPQLPFHSQECDPRPTSEYGRVTVNLVIKTLSWWLLDDNEKPDNYYQFLVGLNFVTSITREGESAARLDPMEAKKKKSEPLDILTLHWWQYHLDKPFTVYDRSLGRTSDPELSGYCQGICAPPCDGHYRIIHKNISAATTVALLNTLREAPQRTALCCWCWCKNDSPACLRQLIWFGIMDAYRKSLLCQTIQLSLNKPLDHRGCRAFSHPTQAGCGELQVLG